MTKLAPSFNLLAAILTALVSTLQGSVIISEFDATNTLVLEDADGSHSDWIELRNIGSTQVSLNGWALSDDASEPGMWIFPDISLDAGQTLLMFASGKDWRIPGVELHTSFKLNSGKGDLLLSQPDGNGGWALIHGYIGYPEQEAGFTFGFPNSDGTGTPGWFEAPTPGDLNGSEVVNTFVKDTSFDTNRGFFTEPFTLSITSATPGATVIYTLDGSEPTETNGTQVPALSPDSPPVAQIPISTTTIVRARAVKAGMGRTNIDTQTYIFPGHVLDQDAADVPDGYADWGHSGPDWSMDPRVTQHANPEDRAVASDLQKIPTVSIVMNWNDLFGTRALTGDYGIYIEGEAIDKPASFELLNPDGNDSDPHTMEGQQGRGVVRVFGGSSTGKRWKTDKLSFRFNFWDDLESDVLGEGAVGRYDRLVLDARLNNVWTQSQNFEQRQFGDYVRDALLTDLEQEMGVKSVHSQHVHLYLNGLYWGLYTLHERPDNHFGAAYFGGDADDYDVVKHDPGADNFLVDGRRIDPTAPISKSNHTAGVNYLAMVDLASRDLSIPANYDALADVLDIPAFINHILANFFGGNYDWPQHNWYATFNREDPDGKWRFHSWDAEHVFKYVDYPRFDNVTAKFEGEDRPDGINLQLLQNPEYRLQFADAAHRYIFNGGPFTAERVWNLFEKRFNDIDEAIRPESARWGDSGQQNISGSNPLAEELHLRYTNIPSSVSESSIGRSDTTDFASWYHERERIRTKILGPEPNRITRFLEQLRNAVYNEDHPLGEQPNPMYPSVDAPVFSQHGGIITDGFQLGMSNPNGGGTIYYTVDGSDPREPYSGNGNFFSGTPSTGAVAYSGQLPLSGSVEVRARVLLNGEWSALNAAGFLPELPDAVPASAQNLVVSEIHYHTLDANLDELAAGFPDDGEFEFFEVLNIGDGPVSLRGLTVEQGLDIGPVDGGVEVIQPGASALYVANPEAFVFRYGTGFPIAGRFLDGTSLNNGGERLHVVAEDGSTIVDLTYDDAAPWPLTPDGYGPSLVLLQPRLRDPTDGSNWRASSEIGGSPGSPDDLTYSSWAASFFSPGEPGYPGIAEPEEDPDRDGLSNLGEMFFSTHPRESTDTTSLLSLSIEPLDTADGSGLYAVVTFRYNRLAEGISFEMLSSGNPATWEPPFPVLLGSPIDHGDGTETRRYRAPTPLESDGSRWFSIRVSN
jgi:hypothetical protein